MKRYSHKSRSILNANSLCIVAFQRCSSKIELASFIQNNLGMPLEDHTCDRQLAEALCSTHPAIDYNLVHSHITRLT